MSDKPYLSHSQVNLFANCGEAYRRRYIEKEVIPPGIAALRGSGVHGGAEVNLKQKIQSRQDMSKGDIVDAAVTAFNERKSRSGVMLTDEETSEGAYKVIDKAKDSVVRLSELYADQVAPTIQPVMVEETIRIELPGAFDMLGILDVATEDKQVRDLKTSARAKRQQEADESLQLTWYDMAYRAATGEAPSALVLDNLVDTKTPKLVQLRTTRERPDMDALVNRFNATAGAIQAGVFPPANVGHFLCSRRWCGYFASCPYVNSERKAASEEADK